MKPADIATKARGERTRHVILDAAEELFAQENYDGISIRNVADRAGVQFGLITYHFKNKESLFEAVVTRKSLEVNRRRSEALDALVTRDVESILDAFTRPVLELLPLPEWGPYLRVVAQMNSHPRWAPLAEKLFRDHSMEFVTALHEVLPDLPLEVLARGFIYALSVLAGVSQYGAAMNALSAEHYPTDDFERIRSTMLPFISGGLLALAAAHSEDSRKLASAAR